MTIPELPMVVDNTEQQ